MAASMVMFLTFLILSIFLILAYGSQQILRFYESKPQAIAFFKDGTTITDINAIKNALTQTDKITSFKYVSKEEALQIYKARNKSNPMLLELVTANILPSSLEISTKAPEDLKFVAEIVKKEPVVEEVVFPEDVVASLTKATSLIRMVGVGVVGFLIVFSTLIIVMIIGFKIRLKRDEIETVKLLGATNWFIRMPFIIEGLFYAIFGCLLFWGLVFLFLHFITPWVNNFFVGINFDLETYLISNVLNIVGFEFIVVAVINIISAVFAMGRYLKV